MRLKSIKLVGFKSFVDSTVVPFPTNMTAIVGPNGCGKSNVIDAVRWVMGESSAKHLRGESMTDVIFNGSTHRQPVGQASIELLFDNSAGQLVGEHAAFTEISIKRRVTREGVSQYFLNGSKCRRRDVTDIFLGTGMGPRSYAIIEQGMISRLIESKPEELRVYLEEAAGISKYKERRRETENRMRRTQENLDRLTDIREELGKQLSTLKRQANAAERFAEFKAQERKATASLAALSWSDLDASKASHSQTCVELEQQIEDLVIEKSAGQSKIEAVRSELEAAIEAFQALQGQYYKSGAEIAKLEQELKFERQRAEKAAEDRSHITDEIRRAEERLNLLREELEERRLELEDLAPELEILHEEQEVQAERVAEAEIGFQSWLQQNEQKQESHAQARSSAESQQSKVAQLEAKIQQYNARLVALGREHEQILIQSNEVGEGDLSEQLLELDEQIEQVVGSLAQTESANDGLRTQLNGIEELISEKRSELSSERAVHASLAALQKDALSAAELGSGELTELARQKGLSSVIGQLRIEDEWGRVVEAVLGDCLHGFVTTDKDLSDFDFPSNTEEAFALFISQTAEEAAVGALAEKVSGCSGVVGLLNRYKCAESLGEALKMRASLGGGELLVSKDGFVVGRTVLQSFGVGKADDGLVVRQARIDELAASIAEKSAALDLEIEQRDVLKDRIKASTSDMHAYRESQKKMSKQQAQLSAELSGLKAKREQILLRKQRVEDEMYELKSAVEEERALLEEARDEWQSSMLTLDSTSQDKEVHAEQRDALRQQIEQARDAQRDAQSKLHALTLSKQKTADRLDVLRHSESDVLEALDSKRSALEALADIELDSARIEELQGTLQDELVAHERDEKKLVEARESQEALQARLRESEVSREKSESSLLELRGNLEQQRLQVQALSMEQDQKLRTVLENDYELEPLLLELQETEVHVDSLRQELERLASKIQRLGPINLAAVDEYEAQSERKNYLDMQHDELAEALETLEGAIRKIDKETRIRFKETYDRVNAGLQDLFPKIFGGGSAKLELTDSDMLETGVSIIARPPGKNNSTIHLLSGGEKALTALALIFSIFKLNPAPFCMLDEVDAPLDDANVGRFARLVKEMSSTVQFIYISHNKVSMEMADQLMGVTMHEPGVSRLVSVDIEAAAQLAEA